MSYGSAYEKLCWVFLEWRRSLQKRLLPYGITMRQYALMELLCKKGPLHPCDLAKWLHCDRPTATVIIHNLDKLGLLTKSRKEDNAKYIWVELTQEGRQFMATIAKELPLPTGHPLDVLSDEELAIFENMLRRVKKRVKELT